MTDRGPREIFDQLLERYSMEWEHTASLPFGTNLQALQHILQSSRLGSVTNIVIYGLGDGGTPDEQVRNADLSLNDDFLEYTQKTFFTQLAVTRLMRELMAERFRLQLTLYAYDPDFTPHHVASLGFLDIVQLDLDPDGMWWHNRGSLIYDVTQITRFVGQKINFTWHGDLIPPAAILTCVTSLARHRIAPRPGDPPKEIDPRYLRKYYMLSLMDLQAQTTTPVAERQKVDDIEDRELQFRAMEQLREHESRLTQAGYERMLVQHDAIMDAFDDLLTERTREIEQYYRSLGDEASTLLAGQYASEQLITHIPGATNSYVSDPMMVLLYRKPAPTQ